MVKNLLLVIVIIAGTALLFSEDTFSEAGEAVDPVTAQAACYAGILGIPTPRVYDRSNTRLAKQWALHTRTQMA